MENNGFLKSIGLLFRSRKEIVFASTWTAALASIIAGGGFPPISLSIFSIMAVMLINLSVYIYNDIIDRKMDAYSKQDKKKSRPIANGQVSLTNAKRFVYITGILGLGICLLVNIVAFGVGLVYFFILILYSYPGVRFKTRFIIKTLITSLVPAATLIITGLVVENRISNNISFLALAYFILSFTAQPVIADMLDFEEDLAFNVKTLGNTLTWRQNLLIFNFGLIFTIITGLVYYKIFGLSYFIPITLSVLCIPGILYSYKLRNESGLTASHKLRPIGFALILSTPLIIALGIVF
jgi:4-hydroxybenzoate polyprenyltransferase